MTIQVIGRCGNCGGRVTVPSVWLGIYPPVPTCESCGATAKPSGPTIDMNPPPPPPKPQGAGCDERTRW